MLRPGPSMFILLIFYFISFIYLVRTDSRNKLSLNSLDLDMSYPGSGSYHFTEQRQSRSILISVVISGRGIQVPVQVIVDHDTEYTVFVGDFTNDQTSRFGDPTNPRVSPVYVCGARHYSRRGCIPEH